MDIFRQAEDFGGVGITTHETDTGDETFVAADEAVQEFFVKGFADVLPEMLTMASRAMTRTPGMLTMVSRAMTRTPGEVERKRHLSGNLLKNYVK